MGDFTEGEEVMHATAAFWDMVGFGMMMALLGFAACLFRSAFDR